MVRTYKYERPEGPLYKVSIRKWNKRYACRGRWPFTVVEVYLRKDSATIQIVASPIGKATLILLAPLIYIYGTLDQGVKETHKDIKEVLQDKKYGRFTSETIPENQIMEFIEWMLH